MNYDFLDKLTKSFAKLKEAFADTKKEASATAKTINSEFAEVNTRLKTAIDTFKLSASSRMMGQNEASSFSKAMREARNIQSAYHFAKTKGGGKIASGKAAELASKLGGREWESLEKHAPKVSAALDEIITELQRMDPASTKSGKSLNTVKKSMQGVSSAAEETQDDVRGLSSGMTTLSNVSSRLITRVTALIAAYAGFRAVKGYVSDILEAGKNLEMLTHRSSLFFGSKGEAENAIEFVKGKIASGKAAIGTVEEMVEGMNSLQGLGIDAKKNFDLLSNIAGSAGKSLSDVSSALSSGDWSGFAIPPAYTKFFEMLKGMPAVAVNAQLAWLGTQKQFTDGAAKMSNTWEGLTTRLKTQWTQFKEWIVGKESDPNSLYATVKSFLKRITEWFQSNKEKVQAYAQGIGEILKWAWRKAENFLTRIASGFKGLSVEGIQDKFMRIVVWLDAVTIKIGRFFDKWGSIISTFVKGAFFMMLFNKLSAMAGFVSSIGSGLTGLGSGKGGVGTAVISGGGTTKTSGSKIGGGIGGLLGNIASFIVGPQIGEWISEKTGLNSTIAQIGTTALLYKYLGKFGAKFGSWSGGYAKKAVPWVLKRAGAGILGGTAAMYAMEKLREKGGTSGTGAADYATGLKSLYKEQQWADVEKLEKMGFKYTRPLSTLETTTKKLSTSEVEEARKQLLSTAKPIEETKKLKLEDETLTLLAELFGKKMEVALMRNSNIEFSKSLAYGFQDPRYSLSYERGFRNNLFPYNDAKNKDI